MEGRLSTQQLVLNNFLTQKDLQEKEDVHILFGSSELLFFTEPEVKVCKS